MIERAPNIYQLDIPLRNNPLKSLNCYLIVGVESLIIDTGFHTAEGEALIREAMAALGMEPSHTRLFLTHLHSDHTGLADRLAKTGVRVSMGPVDLALLRSSLDPSGDFWQEVLAISIEQGLSADHLALSDHPGFRYRPLALPEVAISRPGDRFLVGDYLFEVIDLPGHTPGLQALYEPKHGLLFSSDHILEQITPNITYWGERFGDSLGQYLGSLDQVLAMTVTRVFSSHRSLPTDHRARIDQIKRHHELRLQECRAILQGGPASVREVTRKLSWDIRATSWEDFPASQKWFAAGEAQAHLVHLVARGELTSEKQGEELIYRLK